jgi:23S rRNA pseudoU1915 N3-methylase RlmH
MLEVKAKLIGSYADMMSRLSSIELFSIKTTDNGVSLLRVESRDIQKKPFLFILISLGKESAKAEYTIAPDSSPKLRRLSVIKTMLSILSLVSDIYTVDNRELFQLTDSSIDNVLDSMSQSYSTLFNNYDSLFNEYREIKRLNIELTSSNKNLTVQASQISEENKRLQERLKALETYSDDALMAMVQDWIESHGNTIDINEFANNYKTVPARAEQILNKMVSMGYVEIKS